MNEKKRFFSQLRTSIITVVLTIAVIFAALCIYCGGYSNLLRTAKLGQALRIIDDGFVVETDLDAVVDDAVQAMIASLDDRWSYYMTQSAYEAYQLRVNNSYRGIGITVEKVENGFLIVAVSRDTPAFAAGLLSGETIVSFNGESSADKEITLLQNAISAAGDEEFTLGVEGEDGVLREVTLSAAEVFTSPVDSELLGDNVGYIRLSNFSSGCAENAIAAIDELIENGAKSLVFDVRYNGGGFVHELTELLDYLLPEGEIFISRSRDGKEEIIRSDESSVELPMAVLINSESYSAAELFAAQLSEFGYAITVGEATTGKGRSQINFLLFDGSVIHMSHEQYLTSQRRDLSEAGGISPDIDVPISDEEKNLLYYMQLPHEEDAQLNAAIAAISD